MNGVASSISLITAVALLCIGLFSQPLKAETQPAEAADKDTLEFPHYTRFTRAVSEDSVDPEAYEESAVDYPVDNEEKRDHLLRFARRLNNDYNEDIFAKRGSDDHLLRFAKRD